MYYNTIFCEIHTNNLNSKVEQFKQNILDQMYVCHIFFGSDDISETIKV